MSQHNRNRDNFSWTKPGPKPPKIPKRLRGREIGLYFRDQQKLKTKIHRDYIVNLTIPPAVITVIENDIESIKDLAKESNILIPEFTGLNLVKSDIKPEECDYSSDTGFTTNNDEMSSSFNEDLNSPSTSSCSKSYNTNDVKIKAENIENSEIACSDAGTAITKTIENVKTEPQGNIKIKEESSSSNERIFSLRGAGDFKYGYEDIITGTFEEKLNECLAKGLSLTKKCLEVDNFCVKLKEGYNRMINRTDYKKFKQFRETLPTYKKSTEVLKVINNNQVIVISGETGCGKSTQVPQLILDEAINNNKGGYVNILVTQPRRIAASSLAMRVAQERSERMGDSVGYAVRLEKVDARARGSIMFMTTGILLATLEVDQALSNYTHVILDEVHERTCQIDLAMSMLKKVLPKRKELKVILMSATIDAETLSQYFDNCPMLHIEGLAYPVKDVYLEEILEMTQFKLPFVDNSRSRHNQRHKKKKAAANEMEKEIQYRAEIAPWLESVKNQISRNVYLTLQDHRIEVLNMDLLLELLLYICNGPPGAVLIFLPGIVDISKLLGAMQNSRSFPSSHFYIYPLHSKLPSLEQHKIFERPPPHVRKIIVATNIAETSITVDDIVYVIDCGRMKYSGLNIETNVATLGTEWVAQANLMQRRGRAGRCQPGVCFHLLSTGRAHLLEERILPEIQRDSLLEPVLTIKRLRLGKAAEALNMLPSPPADTTIKAAVKHLQQCGALNYMEKLNPLGWHLARLPVHPAAGKLLLLGSLFGCLNRAASVAAVWGFKDPFQLVIGKEAEVDAAKRVFSLGGGSDHIAISEAIIGWENKANYEKRHYAYNNFLSNNTLELLSDMKRQLGDNLKQMGFLPSGDITSPWENRNTDNLTLFKAIVAAALYPNVATAKWTCLNTNNPRKPPRVKARTENGLVYIHPSSVIADKRPRRGVQLMPICSNPGANWIVYWRQQHSTKLYLLEVTLVQTLPLLFFGELSVTEGAQPDECYISITTAKVCSKIHTTELLIQLRGLLDQVLASKIGASNTHATIHNPFEEKVLNAVIQLITAEEEQAEYPDDDDPSESDNSEMDSTGFEDEEYV